MATHTNSAETTGVGTRLAPSPNDRTERENVSVSMSELTAAGKAHGKAPWESSIESNDKGKRVLIVATRHGYAGQELEKESSSVPTRNIKLKGELGGKAEKRTSVQDLWNGVRLTSKKHREKKDNIGSERESSRAGG